MNKVCFVLDCHYPNYTERLKKTSLRCYVENNLSELGIGFLISTNRPKDFEEYISSGVIVYDIEELRKEFEYSIMYEILPDDPTGIYPSGFPWNIERFIMRKAAEMGFNVVVNLDSDVVFNSNEDAKNFLNYIDKIFEKNTVITNQAIFVYEENSTNEIFHLHKKYINHFNFNFHKECFNSMDGPVIIYMGETPQKIIDFFDNWNMLTEFGYIKEFGFGYEGIVCGNWSLSIPMSGFSLKWKDLPLTPIHNFEDRY